MWSAQNNGNWNLPLLGLLALSAPSPCCLFKKIDSASVLYN